MGAIRAAELRALPRFRLSPEVTLYRIYPCCWPLAPSPSSAVVPGVPAWFCGEGDHRFDFPRGNAGTCYLSTSETGAVIEVFERGALHEAGAGQRRLAVLTVRRPVEVLDLTGSADAGEGSIVSRILGERGPIGGHDAYEFSQRFAWDLFCQGISGVKWLSCRDPDRKSENLAIFRARSGADAGSVFRVDQTRELCRVLITSVGESLCESRRLDSVAR
ncbi:RES family NAD+ phosphorylase [Herbidospora sp. RD11066]